MDVVQFRLGFVHRRTVCMLDDWNVVILLFSALSVPLISDCKKIMTRYLQKRLGFAVNTEEFFIIGSKPREDVVLASCCKAARLPWGRAKRVCTLTRWHDTASFERKPKSWWDCFLSYRASWHACPYQVTWLGTVYLTSGAQEEEA